MSRLDDLFAQFGGGQIAGGCDECDAYQSLESVAPGVHALTVHHDDDCPVLRSLAAETN
jgi:hypothetical protein